MHNVEMVDIKKATPEDVA